MLLQGFADECGVAAAGFLVRIWFEHGGEDEVFLHPEHQVLTREELSRPIAENPARSGRGIDGVTLSDGSLGGAEESRGDRSRALDLDDQWTLDHTGELASRFDRLPASGIDRQDPHETL